MKKLSSIILATLFLSQPLFAAGGYSSGTSSASTNASKDPFAAVYQLIEAKKFAEAHKALKILNVPTKQADKFNLLGFTARKSGDLEKASDYYNRALEINPKHVRALEYQGELFMQTNRQNLAEENLNKLTLDFLKEVNHFGASRLIYTDINKDGMKTGPNFEETSEVAQTSNCPVIISGGVSSIDDIKKAKELNNKNIEGIIVGKAIYDGDINLDELAKEVDA